MKTLLPAFILSLFLYHLAYADSIPNESPANESQAESSIGIGHLNLKDVKWLYGGIDFGYGGLTTSQSNEVSKNGLNLNLKVLTEVYSIDRFAFDLGVGWLFNSVKGSGIRINTNAIFLEIGSRYQLTNRLHLGLLSQVAFSSDISFSQTNSDQSVGLFFGPTVLYELPFKKRRLRMGANFLTDINIGNRRVYFFQATVQLGFPVRLKIRSNKVAKKQVESTPATVRMVLDSHTINFSTGKSSVQPKAKKFLMELGEYLSRNSSLWTKIEVQGHTDKSGSRKLNRKLSKIRAMKVLKNLVFHGVPAKRISAKGLGYTQPREIASQKDWKQERRIELIFAGVANTDRLSDGIALIYKKHFPVN